MPEHRIPDEDLHLVTELLETLTIIQVAKKWEASAHTVCKFLKRNGTSVYEIRFKYKVRTYLELRKKGIKTKVIAEGLNTTQSHLNRVMRMHRKNLREGANFRGIV